MSKLRRAGLVFLKWKGDHGPEHVHVFRDGRLVVKWDLENGKAMEGKPTRRVLDAIEGLVREGLL